MKTKVFLKIIAVALSAMMTTCLTSCEDERNYNTGNTTVIDTTTPRSSVELNDVHIDRDPPGRFLCLHLSVCNLTVSPKTVNALVTVKVTAPDNAKFYQYDYDIGDYDPYDINEDIGSAEIKSVVYGFWTLYTTSTTATVTVIDNYTKTVVGEWEIDINGINDSDLIH